MSGATRRSAAFPFCRGGGGRGRRRGQGGVVSLLLLAASAATAGAAPTWNLETADTHLSLTIQADHPTVTVLSGARSGSWNWAPQPIRLPLLARVTVEGISRALTWRWADAQEDRSHGQRITLRFTADGGDQRLPGAGLTLVESWWAAPGPGPVEVSSALINQTGRALRLANRDIVVSATAVTPDRPVRLWRFGRQSVNVKSDPDFDHGVWSDLLTPGAEVESTVSNETTAGPYRLPFVMLDAGGVHGLYFGYESDFGRFSQMLPAAGQPILSRFYLWDSGQFAVAPGATLPLPGMFYGCYDGDTDAGSNRMKQWFWREKIPRTLRITPQEPLVEMNIATELRPITVQTNTEAVVREWFARHPVKSWGVELTKLDAGWCKGFDDDTWSWDPNPTTWPDGMVAPEIAHRNGVKISLYLFHRYRHADLATPAGVRLEQQALLTRFDHWHYDFWRTDGELETGTDYLSHLGFLQVLDEMIAARPAFRWENCSAGGSKKSFDLLERQSMMTLEDSGGWFPSLAGLNYLKAYYANSYMICPVQMKDDNVDTPNYPPAPGMIDTIPWEKYTYRTGFLGAWMDGFGGRVYPEHTALYRSRQRPILRGADVYHLDALPFPDGRHWDGFEFYNPGLAQGSVVLLKPRSPAGASPRLFLKGLDPAGRYRLEFQDRSELNHRYADVPGAALMAGGEGIAPFPGQPGDYDSEIIWITNEVRPRRAL